MLYVMQFQKDQWPPPAQAFWSLAMYDTEFFFVPNPIGRYELGERDRSRRYDGHADRATDSTFPGRRRAAPTGNDRIR
jgi:hypothetical protein